MSPSESPNALLQRELQQRSQSMLRSELCRKLGYHRVTEQLLTRLNTVINDSWLGLDQSAFDLRFSRDEFLDRLCAVLEVDKSLVDSARQQIRAAIHHKQTAFKSWVLVDTGFDRKEHPGTRFFILALMEGKRRLSLPLLFCDLPINEQIKQVQELIRNHYSETAGELPIWGAIQKYIFFCDYKRVLVLQPDGRLIDELQEYEFSTAMLSLNHREIPNELMQNASVPTSADTE